ncbi:MAG TPA: hypothetical protein O0X33_07615 [Methanocorpusculum sp.]|nr:hypothetical protein [Candidatus Methanocorpusculum faecipullorum]HJK11924.1 hypothetical protein [Methanocorpusculum sp.]HJK23382.1 hypothetical protein [Methanocorpusculum sp.]HJK56703.1 hypothetical protein [Methanocorpusculum sp.]HJK62025.1 hypothetical protein [Methanocorpusculum sp.]
MTEETDRAADITPEKTNPPKRRRVTKKKTETETVQAPTETPEKQTENKIELAAIEATTETEEKATEEAERPHKAVPEQFLNDLAQFADILEKTPALLDPIREVFEYHLVDPIDRKTFPRMVNAMSMLLGPSATMVVMTACHVNSAAFFEDLLYAIKDEKSRGAVWIIQHLTALYGNRVQQAYTLSSGTMDEDWHTVDVNTYKREGENAYWIVDVKMMLYSGKESQIKMTPDSIFQLVEILAAELGRNIPIENVDPGLVKKCEENFTIFYEKFYGAKKCEETEKTDGEEEHPPGYA